MCGLKISIFCTDFDKTCFSYCNDERLEQDTEKLFRLISKPIWMNRFRDEDYPFKSVKGEIREKLVFGKKVEPTSNNTKNEKNNNHQEGIPSLLAKRDFMEKLGSEESFPTNQEGSDQSVDSISKKLKIPHTGFDIENCRSSGGS